MLKLNTAASPPESLHGIPHGIEQMIKIVNWFIHLIIKFIFIHV